MASSKSNQNLRGNASKTELDLQKICSPFHSACLNATQRSLYNNKSLHLNFIGVERRAVAATEDAKVGKPRGARFTVVKIVEIVDLIKLFEKTVFKFKDDSFIYLTYTLPKSSELFTPYSLKQVPFSEVDENQFYTVSRHGVTFWSPSENHFTKLSVWLAEYEVYQSLMKIRLFRLFRIWKQFKIWRVNIKWRKFMTAQNVLEESLFIVIPPLALTLIELNTRLLDLRELKLLDCHNIQNWALDEFIETQMATYEKTRDILSAFRDTMKSLLFQACYKSMIYNNFSPIDEIELYASVKKMKDNMSFIDRTRKRRFCILLGKFLNCCDFMTINALHKILTTTFQEFANMFELHEFCAPSMEVLGEILEMDKEMEEERPPDYPKTPFLVVSLVLQPKSIEMEPPRVVVIEEFRKLVLLIRTTVFGFKRFQSDLFYKQFTKPSIMGRQEDRLCGEPANIDFQFGIDHQFQYNNTIVFEILEKAYDRAELYIERFEKIRIDYEQDMETDPKEITAVTDVATLREFCERYVNEMANLQGILPDINLGLLKLQQNTFKETIIPVCRHLVRVLENHMPRLAIECVAQTQEKLEEVLIKILNTPDDTMSYVNYLRYTEQCMNLIDSIDGEFKYSYELFVLMKEFQVPVDVIEKEKYLDVEDYLGQVKDTLNDKLAARDEFVQNLAQLLQLDIRQVFDDVQDVMEKSVEEWLILEESNRQTVKDTLQGYLDRLAVSQSLSQDYRKFQREFRIDVTRFDMLELAFQEVRNRQLLWASVEEWYEIKEDVSECNFHHIDVEELTATNTKILKNCTVLEKYLPPNTAIQKLRVSAEDFKEKIPTIGYLRNPSIKLRHWIKIEQILNRKLITDDHLTLNTLESVNAFEPDIAYEIMEVSGQASAEAGLEVLLKKVEKSWLEFEIPVVSHRDAKDIFIIAGLDDIQMNLDDSNININTIAASRHVGPIKPRVDEWMKTLELFAETFDEWVSCQQSWMYLEVIFSAPDIQRQLPNESRMFMSVDKSWKEIMRKTQKLPLALPAMTEPGLLAKFKHNNSLLDTILKSIEVYLEIKRVAFPRFYFLSNEELLEVLAQTRNPHAIQPHLRKCFDAIARIEFGLIKGRDGQPDVATTDILAMLSPEGESVQFGKGLKARGSVEDWLSKVEESMVVSLRRCMKHAFLCYHNKDRSEWFQDHANQVVLTVAQQQWATNVHVIMDSGDNTQIILDKVKAFERECTSDLSKLAAIARTSIPKLLRSVLCALITIDVHAKDTITNLVNQKVTKSSDFNWLKMLRYYWVPSSETMEAKMSTSTLPYFYEYLGAGGVLVITPLTDRCYLCLMGALQMDLGGSPAGPAGTGKTETTKDLAKAVAKQCVVFNCSDGLDYKMMGRFFSGLAQSGAWCCFDEFNRIDIEVLSVIAQQLITIRTAKAMKMKRFMFEGREIKLNLTCAAFITMNPGYAGRTELPDNLKALFRPVAMMVPDYALIAEVILYSEGFENSRVLAQKMVQMYKLCSEQLSQQDHYDFGMRAVKSVLVMAGALKRENPNQVEDITLIAALRDANLPKFLAADAKLFSGILTDLFPGVDLPVAIYGELQKAIAIVMEERNLQAVPEMIVKTIQLYETMCVRWGVMLVGLSGSGKTTVLHTLANALTKLEVDAVPGPLYRRVRTQTLNPKSITLDELYGAVNLQTLEWSDGLLGIAIRSAVNVTAEEHQWVVCDGPVDAVWIENMNTVLDDNKMLCLANSERIKLTPWVHLVFEVQDLAQASPATVSRCGMVYCDPGELGWQPIVRSWQATIKQLDQELNDYIFSLFLKYLDDILTFGRKTCTYSIHQVEISKIIMLCTIYYALIRECKGLNFMERDESKLILKKLFIWCALWSIGGNFGDDSRVKIEEFIKTILPDDLDNFPSESLWNYRFNTTTKEWENWNELVPEFKYNPEIPYFDMIVSTADTAKYSFVANLLFQNNKAVMFTGETGVGKSILAKEILSQLSQINVITVTLNFSAQTSSLRTQETIESRLDRRKKTLLGPPIGKRILFFIDDINMPELDTYGSQPPIELLRQLLDFNGLFDREKLFWKDYIDVLMGAACAPPGGGRNVLTARFVRHFSLLQLPLPSTLTLYTIFSSIMSGFLNDFNAEIRPLAEPMVRAAISIYSRIEKELLPTPTKSHYVFNLRDLSKFVQGILQADGSNYGSRAQMLRLFYHESMRVFHDRLINETDKTFYKDLMKDVCLDHFETPIVTPDEVLFFGDFMIFGQAKVDRIYEEIKNMEKLLSILMDYMDDYNSTTGKTTNLILFQDAIEHITRLARLLRSERGNGLLIGLSGMGKQSLSRIGAHINGYMCAQIELCRGYNRTNFHEDLRKMCYIAGATNQPTVFLITDTQIIREDFLEDINNILNSGEVPNLFESDEYEKVILGTRQACISARSECTRDDIFDYFVGRVRANLHLVICMSPIGDAFRRRCRMFPSLVNCCTIDWFVKWPREALYSVALGALKEIDNATVKQYSADLANTCVMMHEMVEVTSERFYNEARRYYYTTPSSYLELLKLYKILLKKREDAIAAKRTRIGNGLSKLLESNELVAVMGEELKSFAPIIEKKAASMKELLIKLDVDTQAANVVRTNVSRDEAEAMIKKNETMAISEDAARDLETAMPALRSAQDALKALNKTDVNELRSFQVPPALVQFVMEPVCILLGAKTNWAAAKQLMSDTNFLKKLVEFDKEHISEKTIARLQTYVDHKDFQPDVIEKVSKVCKSMCLWVKAMVEFAKVYKVVEPKVQRHAAAERELKEVMQVLKQKQSELAQIEAKIQSLKDSIDINNQEFMILQQTADLTAARLNRAGRLTSALSDEEIRWKNTVGAMTVELWAIPGDSLVSAACVAYLGAFPISYRVTLAEKWSAECRRLEIPSSESFNLITILGEPYQLRQWNLFGLPRDDMSLENGIIVMNANRWPLMIDPQEQANRWIRNMEKENELRIMKITDPNLLKLLEICIRQGLPLLIEEIGETIDPTLGPVLSRSVTSQAGRLLIKLGDTDVDYDPRFKLYMTTKLSNPHYLPEICIQITLVNFLVTHSGLEDQLLAEIVAIELPELEKQRSDLVFKINADKQQLLALEDKVLKLLFNSQGNILDDEELVETLNEAKETSAIIAARLIDTEQTEAVITVKREKYRALATRGANLYFVVTNLAEIDSMYQNSLKYFTKIFSSVIALNTEVSANLEQRLNMLMEAETYSIYQNVSRGLFEKHKLVFSFMLAIAVELEMGHLSSDDYQLLLRGPVDTGQSVPKRPDISALSNDQWKNCVLVEEVLANSKGISQELNKTIDLTLGEFTFSVVFVPNAKPSPTNWTKRLTIFERLIIISILRREKFSAACTAYVCATIGRKFTEIPRNNTLSALYTETSNTTPLVFVLSTGSDPMSALLKFSQTLNVSEKLFTISLGQGQGPAAQTLIEKGRITGLWIFLQNCHLATSWMPVMEKIIRDISLGVITAHNDFRLFLSSVPTKSFPVSVLQNSLKLTNEPPKGLRTNLIRTMGEMDKDYFEKHILEDKWRTMVFGICIFHAVVLERRKFGPLGWNIYYDFADSDRECGLKVLDMYCDREERNEIPWDSLGYINGEITWGGRVTDYWDQRCLKTILKTFLSERVLKPDYKYSESGIYRAPSGGLEVYQTYIQTLPLYDDPDIFGMHPNANIVFETNETNFFIGTLLEMSSTVSSKPSDSGAVTLSDDDICLAKIQLISDALTRKILVDKILPSLIATDAKGRVPSLTTVLLQELDRFNNLLVVVHKSLGELKKAIKGLIVMSESLEGIFGAFLINQVPRLWATKGFLSTKSLANWVIDFQYRIDFIQTWVLQGLPRSTWLSGLYFPQSFLTGILQRHARQYNLPIDLLKIDFEVMAQTVLQSDIYQNHKAGQPESKAIYLGVDYPIEGGYVHGLFIEGGQWDGANGGLSDSSYGELMANLPVMWLKPCLVVEPRGRYDAPMYKTQIRAGVLSTTGHSTNFVVSVWLPSRKERDYWILKGTALITMTTE